MAIDKSKSPLNIGEIEFNWEGVKKKAATTREQLLNNAPKVVLRNPAAVDVVSNPHIPKDTAILISGDPMASNDKVSAAVITNIDTDKDIANATSNPTSKSAETTNTIEPVPDRPIDPKVQIDSNAIESGTPSPPLLPGAPAQQYYPSTTEVLPHEVVMDESLGPERNAVDILGGIREKTLVGSDLTSDERRLVVRSMREIGQTQDAIAQLLQVSRRTIVSDCKALRQHDALLIASKETEDIAGEVYSVARTCIRRALAAGSFKTVSTVLRDMVEVLQSLGVVYRAPKTSMQAQWHGSMSSKGNGYRRYIQTIGDDKDKLVEVLDCMFSAIDTDQV